jgi:hypothetical protein
VEEQDRNIESIPHNDGTVFRFLETDGSWRKGFCSKRVEVDLKAIEKRPALYAALAALRPFVGLWDYFQKGTLERINCLKCDNVRALALPSNAPTDANRNLYTTLNI